MYTHMHPKLLQSCPTLQPHGPPGLCGPWDSPRKNTGVGCQFLLQGNLPDPGIKPWSLKSPALASGFFTNSATWESHIILNSVSKFSSIMQNTHVICYFALIQWLSMDCVTTFRYFAFVQRIHMVWLFSTAQFHLASATFLSGLLCTYCPFLDRKSVV